MRRFDGMQSELERHGIITVALSKDTPREAARHKARDGLSFDLWADPELTVIRQFGLEHHKAVQATKGSFRIFGIPLALVPERKTMAIPTTMLVDESGIIRWIDQTDDYRIRGDDRRVLGAVESTFGAPPT